MDAIIMVLARAGASGTSISPMPPVTNVPALVPGEHFDGTLLQRTSPSVLGHLGFQTYPVLDALHAARHAGSTSAVLLDCLNQMIRRVNTVRVKLGRIAMLHCLSHQVALPTAAEPQEMRCFPKWDKINVPPTGSVRVTERLLPHVHPDAPTLSDYQLSTLRTITLDRLPERWETYNNYLVHYPLP
ncbi:hypothetical protein NM688_g4778 [Phlebia brevispora]|uniref:Uncharacterized protein n=1 Tax=Phlebia brevispora TaxID=194682 RepID=A0ACC1T2K1_9APHY|nr:hypothetical protein NM688_g4778 [Phlebia brevispora]